MSWTGVRTPLETGQHRLEDIAFLQYTGVTTEVAKGAMLSHGNVVTNLPRHGPG